MKALFEDKMNPVYDYMTLGQINKLYQAKDYPAPTKVAAALRPAKTQAFFAAAMKNKNSELYKATNRGRKMHTAVETGAIADALTEVVMDEFKTNLAPSVNEVWGAEKGLISQTHRYKGKFDSVGVLNGRPTLWDYKKVNTRKTKSGLRGYFKQLAAYAAAHNEQYNTKIDRVALMMVYGKTIDTISSEIIYLEGDELQAAMVEFFDDVKQFYALK